MKAVGEIGDKITGAVHTYEDQWRRRAMSRQGVGDLLVQPTELFNSKVVGVNSGVGGELENSFTAGGSEKAKGLFMKLNSVGGCQGLRR
jgi:hypothetical protein